MGSDDDLFQAWLDSEDGPGSHDIYEADLKRAYLAGLQRGRNENDGI